MSRKVELKLAFKSAFPITIPILTGFAFLGMAYGILMSNKGYGPLWSFLMSSIAFCGSMQYLAITLLTTTFDPISAFFLSLTVNARHLFYGISMLKKFKGIKKIKYFLIYVLCDETFSVECSTEVPEGINKSMFYFFISFLDYSYWVTFSVIGGIIGSLIEFNTKGIDFVLTAMFVVIFLNQWKDKNNRIPALIGILSSIICLLIFGQDTFIIPSMISILILLSIFKKLLERKI